MATMGAGLIALAPLLAAFRILDDQMKFIELVLIHFARAIVRSAAWRRSASREEWIVCAAATIGF